jgi:phosphate transport system permease protein
MVFALNVVVFKVQKGMAKGGVGPLGTAHRTLKSAVSKAIGAVVSRRKEPARTVQPQSRRFIPTRVLRRREAVAKFAMTAGAVFVTGFLFLIIGDILVNGGLSIKPEYLYLKEGFGGIEGGFLNAITGSLMLVGIALAFAAPLAVGSAIYVNEYAKPGNRLTNVVLFASDTLASTPSIVFGAFGFMFFVLYLRFGFSLLAGGLTLGLMVVPLLLRSSIEALKSIPKDYREASLALGATKWQTIRDAVLPPSLPMISSGVIISIGRAIGETAAILFTAGYTAHVTTSLMEPAASMPNMIFIYYDLSTTFPVLQEKVYSAAFVLIMLVLVLNAIARITARLSSKHSR